MPGAASLALWGLILTILLIAVGSFVRVTGHGLGCPDWPLCYGQAIPPLDIGAWVEFSHRLLAGIVSLFIVGLAVVAWRSHRHDKWVTIPAVSAVVVLAIQVSLGGLHVLNELPRWTGIVHTATAMLIVGQLAVVLAATQPALQGLARRTAPLLSQSRLRLWTTAAAVATYALLITGSLVTRTGSSLACPSFPHCGIAVVPEYLQSFVAIQMIHRYTAFGVALLICILLWQLLHAGREERGLRLFSGGLLALITVQFLLGISNVLLYIPMWSRIAHLTVGGMIWAVMVMLAVILHPANPASARHK